jgi:hypothetical protein
VCEKCHVIQVYVVVRQDVLCVVTHLGVTVAATVHLQ